LRGRACALRILRAAGGADEVGHVLSLGLVFRALCGQVRSLGSRVSPPVVPAKPGTDNPCLSGFRRPGLWVPALPPIRPGVGRDDSEELRHAPRPRRFSFQTAPPSGFGAASQRSAARILCQGAGFARLSLPSPAWVRGMERRVAHPTQSTPGEAWARVGEHARALRRSMAASFDPGPRLRLPSLPYSRTTTPGKTGGSVQRAPRARVVSARRAEPRGPRERGCEPRPRAPRLPRLRIASRSAPHGQAIGL